MTTRRGLQSVYVPPSPLVTILSGRRAPVCPASVPRPARPRGAPLLPASRAAVGLPRRCVWPRGGSGGSAPRIGSSPQTR